MSIALRKAGHAWAVTLQAGSDTAHCQFAEWPKAFEHAVKAQESARWARATGVTPHRWTSDWSMAAYRDVAALPVG